VHFWLFLTVSDRDFGTMTQEVEKCHSHTGLEKGSKTVKTGSKSEFFGEKWCFGAKSDGFGQKVDSEVKKVLKTVVFRSFLY
jgi:hypothetical protein